MNYDELRQGIELAPDTTKSVLNRLFLYVTAGDDVTPEWQPYLQGAQTYTQFFDAIFADDAKKNTVVWAEWAKLTRKSWLGRFQPDIALHGLRVKTDGLPLGFGTGVVLAPTGSRDSIANLYVFQSKAFNASAATFVTSIGGTFTCAGYQFVGVYGLYQYRGNVILETWEEEQKPKCVGDGDDARS